MEYLNEHLLPGKIGHFLLLLGFVASIVAMISYFFATQRRGRTEYAGLNRLGRYAYLLHGFCYLAVIGIIFYIMGQQYYEYDYVRRHVNEELPTQYMFVAFWEGQEGSFLLWMFWHIILGFVLIRTAKEWESPVMSVLSLVQIFIGTMILGLYVYIGETELKIGSNPLVLFRDTMNIPLFNNEDYVSLLSGTGLNPLLQNYWMTIHPPTLFLGFAATIVPFAYAIAGLWTGQHKAWLKPVMPWALFAGCILGIGILMGSAWAYEALTFGGYWAWDPVENTSLVPWIMMVAGIHTNLIARNTGYSIKSTYFFYLLSFILIVYSTTLTRSGILGDTSVHAFTEMGLESQLTIFLGTLILLAFGLFFAKLKQVPAPQKEEETPSKEFWMFIGTLILLFSAVLITISSSLPVYNKLAEFFNPAHNHLVIEDQEAHHNKYQLWIGVLVGLFSGITQYLRFKERNFSTYRQKFLTHSGIAVVIAALLTYLTTLWIEVNAWQYLLLLFSGIFAVVTNLDFLITFIKGNLKIAGSAVSHIGFGLMVVGIIASGTNKFHISKNEFAMRGILDNSRIQTNLLLFKGEPMFMSGYMVNYQRDTMIGNIREYLIECKKLDEDGKPTDHQFTVRPNVLYNTQREVAATNPYTQRYLTEDIFTSVTSVPPHHQGPEGLKAFEDSLKFESYNGLIGDTIFTKKHFIRLLGVNQYPAHPDYEAQVGDIAVGIKVAVQNIQMDTLYIAEPVMLLRGELLYNYPAQIDDLSMKLRLTPQVFESVFTPDNQLNYQTVKVKEGDTFKFKNYNLALTGFNRKPKHPAYNIADESLIAIGAVINATNNKGQTLQAQPIYYIKDNRPLNIKDEIREWQLHFRFQEIDPNTGTMTFQVAQGVAQDQPIELEVAENSLRMDYIVLEATVLPGINLVWLGSIMMMFGLGMGYYRRRFLER